MHDLGNLTNEFLGRYRTAPRLFWAPGRVNLIGEHTDYNDGFVLPLALEMGTVVAAAPAPGGSITVYSADLGETVIFDLDDKDDQRPSGVAEEPGGRRPSSGWQSYVEGMARTLQTGGTRLIGANLLVQSDLPIGSGLSSSAALELSVGLALATLAGARLSPLELALAGQQAEHQFAGVRCGIMDQLIAALGRAGHALLIDCRTHESSLVPISLSQVDIVICDSGIRHKNAATEYNRRRNECEQGMTLLRDFFPHLTEWSALRDISQTELDEARDFLPEVIFRRCRHVVSENLRTLAAARALGAGDSETLGRLMTESHRSLAEDYEVSCPELDLLVEIALKQPGVLGSRMTGGGFGGWTVTLVEKEHAPDFKRMIADQYKRATGRAIAIEPVQASDGAREITEDSTGSH